MEKEGDCKCGEKRVRARERKGAWGKGRKEKTEGNRHPPGGGQKPFTPGETGRGRERERVLRRQREKQRRGAKRGETGNDSPGKLSHTPRARPPNMLLNLPGDYLVEYKCLH